MTDIVILFVLRMQGTSYGKFHEMEITDKSKFFLKVGLKSRA
jgi:hypothetical protein